MGSKKNFIFSLWLFGIAAYISDNSKHGDVADILFFGAPAAAAAPAGEETPAVEEPAVEEPVVEEPVVEEPVVEEVVEEEVVVEEPVVEEVVEETVEEVAPATETTA